MSVTNELIVSKPEELAEYFEGKSTFSRFTGNDVLLIWQAYSVASEAHKDQKRESKEPYIIHPLAVARIVYELGMDAATVAASLLHDVVEDTNVPLSRIQELFGNEVASLVDGVTTLKKYAFYDSEKRDADAIKNIFLAMITDARVIIIKLADRLHNIRTISHLPEERQKRIARETLEIYAPIAERLGIWRIKSELEDLSLHTLEPEVYKQIEGNLEKSVEEHEIILGTIISRIKARMIQAGLQEDHFEVQGRRKHIYSIYKKMNTPKYLGKGLNRIYDKLGIRIVVDSVQDCYAVLGMVHSEWTPLAGEFDDFIGMRLPSGYQSLHTTVKYGASENEVVEFQIRTYQMHGNAEFGIAAHWRYKERGSYRPDPGIERKIAWLRQMLEEPQSEDSESFVAFLKADVLQDRVYAFTPRGDVIDLPMGATPIDFAYHVHTEIGHHCRGAKVNGRLVTLDYQIKTGDVVEILTTKHGGPSRDWLNINLGLVKTQRARSKIRTWFKWQNREQNILQGKTLLEKELKRLGITLEPEKLVKFFDFHSIEELYLAIGTGDLSTAKIINKISDLDKDKAIDPLLAIQPTEARPISDPSAVTVFGLKGMLTTFARCCKPVPGDDIIGYVTRGRGVTVHRLDCPNILRLQDTERVIKVGWGQAPKTYPVSVEVKAYDRQGLIQDVSNILTEENVNILEVSVKVSHHNASISLVLELGDIAQLSRILTRIENLPNVIEAYRVHPG
jgi:GTP diphosphokinase / guanosine-3',5'-bis(diphosphate) 3'-diphosphatase